MAGYMPQEILTDAKSEALIRELQYWKVKKQEAEKDKKTEK